MLDERQAYSLTSKTAKHKNPNKSSWCIECAEKSLNKPMLRLGEGVHNKRQKAWIKQALAFRRPTFIYYRLTNASERA